MRNARITRALSIILGLFLVAYAANQFLHVLPTSYGQMPDFTRRFLDSIVVFLPALYIFEMIIGVMFLLNIWVPFISVVLAPLSVSFLIFNFANGDWNIFSAAFVAVMNFLLLIRYWDKYQPLFT